MLVLVIGDLHLPHRASDLPSKFRKLLVPGKIQQIICTGNVCDRETLDYLRTIAGDVHVVKGDWDENPYFANTLVLQHLPLRIGVLHGHQIIPPGDADSLCSIARSMDVDILITGHTHRFDAFERDGRFFVNPGSATGAWSSVWPVAVEEAQGGEAKSKPAAETAKAADVEKVTTAKDGKDVDVKESEASEEAKQAKQAKQAEQKDGEKDTKKTSEEAHAKATTPATDQKAAAAKALKAAPEPTPSFALLDIHGPAVVTYVYQLIDGEVKVEKMEFRKKIETGGPGAPGYVPADAARSSSANVTPQRAAGVRY